MEIYCVSCRKFTANKNLNVRKTKHNRLLSLWNCAVFGKKKLNFIKNRELYKFNSFKMNKIIKKIFLD